MLNLPQGYEKYDAESKNQALLVAITAELEKSEKDVSILRGLVVSFAEEQKRQGGALNAILGDISNILPRLNILESFNIVPKATPIPKATRTWLDRLLKRK